MIGIHIKVKKNVDVKQAFKYAHDIGCTHVQMFNENMDGSQTLKSALKKYNLKLVIHAPYIINIASHFDPTSWRTKYLLLEIENSIRNGAIGLVVHMGKRMTMSEQMAYNNMYRLLELVSRAIKNKNFNIYLETTAGQGTELCYKMDDLQVFYNRIKNNPKMKMIKICLDTCHLFSAGYDLRSKTSVNKFINNFDKTIGIKYVGLIHLNDSMHEFDTRKDRHANIGEGYIGAKGLRCIYKYFSEKNIPCIMETPVGDFTHEIKTVQNK